MASDYTPQQVAELHARGEIQLIDVRQPDEHEAGRIAGDRLIELMELSSQADTIDHGFAMRRGDMPLGEIQRAYSSNASSQVTSPLRTSWSCSGWVSSAHTVPAIALRGSF